MNDNPTTSPAFSRSMSEYGLLTLEACDLGLRQRVVSILHPQSTPKTVLSTEQLRDLSTYVAQLEDALLRHHWGQLERHQIHEILRCNTGLDMEGRANELDAMAAVDA